MNLSTKIVMLAALLVGFPPRAVRADEAEDQYTVAASHYAAQRWEMAVDEFRALIKAHPAFAKTDKSLFFLGEALVQLGKYDEARTQFDKFLARDPKGSYAKQGLFRAGEMALMAGAGEAAQKSLAEFRDKYPDDPLCAYVLMYQGELALGNKDGAAAESAFELALKQYPDAPPGEETRFNLARSLELQNKWPEAEKSFRQLTTSKNAALAEQAQLRLGMAQLQSKQWVAAVSSFEIFEGRFQNSRALTDCRLAHAGALEQLGKHDESRSLLESMTDGAAHGAAAQYQLGLTSAGAKDWPAAIRALTRALAQAIADDPKKPLVEEIRHQLADVQYLAGQFDDAIKTLTEAKPSEPTPDAARPAEPSPPGRGQVESSVSDSASPHPGPLPKGAGASLANQYLLAIAYQGAGKDAEALATLDLARPKTGLDAKIELARATSQIALRRWADAAATLHDCLSSEMGAENVDRALGQLAVCYARSGQIPRAKETFAKLKSRQPASNAASQSAPSEFLLAATEQLADAVSQPDDKQNAEKPSSDQAAGEKPTGDKPWAAELYASLAADGNPPQYLVKGLSGLGWSQLESGETDKASATFERLLQKFPDGPYAADAAWAKGSVCERTKKFDASLSSYQLILDKYKSSKHYEDALLAAARIQTQLHQYPQAIENYRRLVSERPESTQIDAVRYAWGWTLRDAGQLAAADEQFQKLHDDFPKSRLWPDATFRLAESASQAKKSDQAQKLLDDLIAAKPAADISQHALYLSGQLAAAAQKWDRTSAIMQQLTHDHPDSPLRLAALYWVAEAAYRQGRFAEAGERFTLLSQQVAGRSDKWLAMIPLRRAQVLAQEKQWPLAQEIAGRIETDYPDFSEQYEVDYLLGRAFASQADFDGARRKYGKVLRSATGGKSETAAMAQWMIGESYFHQENYEAAMREYLRVEILFAYPRWQAAALLQAGKCEESLNRAKDASQLYARLIKAYGNSEFTDEAAQRLRAIEDGGESRKPAVK